MHKSHERHANGQLNGADYGFGHNSGCAALTFEQTAEAMSYVAAALPDRGSPEHHNALRSLLTLFEYGHPSSEIVLPTEIGALGSRENRWQRHKAIDSAFTMAIARYARSIANTPRDNWVDIAILHFIAVHSDNDHGRSTESQQRMATFIGCDERTIRRRLDLLADEQIVVRVERAGLCTAYSLVYEKEVVAGSSLDVFKAVAPRARQRGRPARIANDTKNPGQLPVQGLTENPGQPPRKTPDSMGVLGLSKNPGHHGCPVFKKTQDNPGENPGHHGCPTAPTLSTNSKEEGSGPQSGPIQLKPTAEPTTQCGVSVASDNNSAARAVSSTTPWQANRLTHEWALPDEWRQWSKDELGFHDAHVDKLAEVFRAFWTASDRRKPEKREWFAIWQDWACFEAFWRVFPSERRQKKAEARQTFFAIINGEHKSLGKAKPDTLIEAAKRYNCGLKERKFAQMPTTWLNSGCWEDDGNQPQENAGTKPNDPYEMPEYNPVWDNNPLGEDCSS
jgi:hypothetical protein